MPLPFIPRRRGPPGPGSSTGPVHGTWVPTDLGSKLIAWWHADDTVDGAVATWTDRKATLGMTAGAASPTSAVASGYRQISFDGTTQYFRASVPTLTLPTGATPSEIWVLCNVTAAGGVRTIVSYGASGTQFRSVRRGTTPIADLSVLGTTATAHADTAHTWTTGVAAIQGYFGVTDNSGRFNGEATTPASTAHGGTMATTTISTTFGANNASTPATFWQGTIRHVLVTLELTASEREKLEAWLLWNILQNALLPVGHPYRIARP